MKKIKIGFFGTPKLSSKVLEDLMNNENFEIKFVVTNPDKPFGRKQILTASEVAQSIEGNENIALFKPTKVRDENFYEILKSFDCDYFVVVAYGKILPKEILEIPKKMCINVHGSILPKYRGASPIQSVLLNGEKETGVTIMEMDEKMDEGDMILIEKIAISSEETSETLFEKFCEISGKTLINAILGLEKGELKPVKQDDNLATYCSKITKEDGKIDLNENFEKIFYKWQAYTPWPGIFAFWNEKRILLEKIHLDSENIGENGKIFKNSSGKIAISVNSGSIILEKVKIEGKKSQNIEDFVNGNKDFIGSFLK